MLDEIKNVLSHGDKGIEYFVNEQYIPLSMLSSVIRDVVKMVDDYDKKHIPLSKKCVYCSESTYAVCSKCGLTWR